MKTYYSNGKIKTETKFKNGFKNGIEKSYYKNGELNWTQNYTRDTLTGKLIKYYNSGNIEYEFKYEKGELINEGKMYYENGAIKNYLYYDPYMKGKVAFKVSYNKDSTINKIQGDPIMTVLINESVFEVGDDFSVLINYAKPDLFKTLGSVVLTSQPKHYDTLTYAENKVPFIFKKTINDCSDSLLIVNVRMLHNTIDTSFYYDEKADIDICQEK